MNTFSLRNSESQPVHLDVAGEEPVLSEASSGFHSLGPR